MPRDLELGKRLLEQSHRSLDELESEIDYARKNRKIERSDKMIKSLIRAGSLRSPNAVAVYTSEKRLDKARSVLEKQVEDAQQALGHDHPMTLHMQRELANIYEQRSWRNDALRLAKETLETAVESFGVHHDYTMRSEEQVADFYSQQNRWNDAEELYRTLLGRAKEPNHLRQYNRKSLLAGIIVLQGNYEEAIVLGTEVKEAFELSLGMDHPDTFDSISSLAHYYKLRHSCDRAMTLEHQALEGRERVLGQYHLDTLASMGNLAIMYRELASSRSDFDLLKKANHLEVRVLKGRRRILESNHPHTLTAMANLATTFSSWPKKQEEKQGESRKIGGGCP